jgi:DNA invertase Pin-like site-specific DNA recombinase
MVQPKVRCMKNNAEKELKMGRVNEISISKVSGGPLGRPKASSKNKLDDFRQEIVGLLQNGSSQKFIALHFSVTEPTLYHWIKKNNLKTSRTIKYPVKDSFDN